MTVPTAPAAADRDRLTPEQRGKERSLLFGLVADLHIWAAIGVAGFLGGSLTSIAEWVRGGLMNAIEGYALLVLRRIHRGSLAQFEFGAGKLEQVCNLAIALGMLAGSAWIAYGAMGLLLRGETHGSPLGLALAAALGAVNTLINFVAWDEVRRAAAAGGERSVIMQAQVQARLTKLVSSLVVQVSMTVAATARDAVIAAWADGLGALFVAVYLFATALPMLRAGLPDLLDRSLDEAAQIAILRVLARHFDLYDRLVGVRTRRAGAKLFVEIGLGFAGHLAMDEVDGRMAAIRATALAEIEGVEVTILAAAVEEPPA
jgi:divalent metal cation (Fe/Co/Zn/Cd) transporter